MSINIYIDNLLLSSSSFYTNNSDLFYLKVTTGICIYDKIELEVSIFRKKV